MYQAGMSASTGGWYMYDTSVVTETLEEAQRYACDLVVNFLGNEFYDSREDDCEEVFDLIKLKDYDSALVCFRDNFGELIDVWANPVKPIAKKEIPSHASIVKQIKSVREE